MALSLTFLTRFLANSSISSCAIIDLSTEFLSPRYYISGLKLLFGAMISARDVVKVRKEKSGIVCVAELEATDQSPPR